MINNCFHSTDSGQRACPICNKSNPGAGYRLLEIGETIRGTDETFFRPVIDPGVGYRLLKTGEIIQTGDEIWENGNTWFPRTSLSIGLAQGRTGVSFPTRRKIEADPGEGYRLIKVGEKIELGDEMYRGNNWKRRFATVGDILRDDMKTTRRKIVVDPGVGYRLLKVGEVRQRGDEYRSKFPPSWVTTEDEGEPISSECSLTYRRKIAVEKAIDPGVGYRLLASNEILAVGDELYHSFSELWEPFYEHTAGQPLCPGLIARRRVEVDPGVGYRLLTVGEMREAGDEFFGRRNQRWNPINRSIGQKMRVVSNPTRRKIAVKKIEVDPGVGYRLLEKDEVFQKGDDHFNSETGKWWACHICRPGNIIYVAPGDFSCAATRRKIARPKQYRLLAVGEIIRETDEMWYGLWVPCTGLTGVKTAREGNSPIRREISDYIGGPA